MLPLQILKIFDFQQPRDAASSSRLARNLAGVSVTEAQADASAQGIFVERRRQPDRRAIDRREKQLPTFLNTRKTQGRRQSPGRRASDANPNFAYRRISLKG